MKFSIYFKGSSVADGEFETLNDATEYMASNRYTGIVAIRYPESRVEIIWYNQGKRR
jgi:hypothetical protein